MARARRLCKDCDKTLGRNAWSRGAERCLPCSAKAKVIPRPLCPDCGKTLGRTAIWSGTKRCAICAAIAKRGIPHSEEHKRKIGLKSLGRRHSAETIAKMRQIKMGHPVSAEARAKIGAHNPHRRDGRSHLPYMKDFTKIKEVIRKRDEHLCQHPGCYIPENGKKHDCHHIDRDKTNDNPVNLILLCFKHHIKTRYGDADYWKEFYQEVQSIRGIS